MREAAAAVNGFLYRSRADTGACYHRSATAMPESQPGFLRYRVLKELGHGGMGRLYLAWDPQLERHVAIKALIDDGDELRERFAREARSAARLRHGHIVTIYDIGEADGQPFLVMEFVEGRTLSDIIRKREPLSLVRKLQIGAELAEGLACAHRGGVVHRDVKPSNVMLDEGGAVKILDFGVARLMESVAMTLAGTPVGTANYMSPEQLAGRRVDRRSDVFSFGATLYELLVYRQAFPGAVDSSLLRRIARSEREPLERVAPHLDPDVIEIVDRAMEPDARRRYQDLAGVARDLDRIRHRLLAVEETASTMAIPRSVVQAIRASATSREPAASATGLPIPAAAAPFAPDAVRASAGDLPEIRDVDTSAGGPFSSPAGGAGRKVPRE
jgi:serine/threonine-protein kinase